MDDLKVLARLAHGKNKVSMNDYVIIILFFCGEQLDVDLEQERAIYRQPLKQLPKIEVNHRVQESKLV
jgi:hypothetical protein